MAELSGGVPAAPRQDGDAAARAHQLRSAWALAGLAVLSLLGYWLLLVRPIYLFDIYRRPLLDLYDLAKDRPTLRWSLTGLFVAEGVLYWIGWRVARRARGKAAWLAVLAGAAALGACLLWVYPIDAADIFDNITHGRILGVYGANPFREVAADFPADPFLPYTAWRRFPSAYGPLWEIMAGVTARLAGGGVIANVIAFKLLVGVFYAASVAMVAAVLLRVAPGRALAGVLWLAWNPIVLYETWGNGHNDVVMAFWILLAAWAMIEQRYTLAVLALVAGALVKFVPLLLVPAAGLVALRELPSARRRRYFVVVTGLLALCMVALAYRPFWFGLATLRIGGRAQLLTSSLPAVVQAILQSWISEGAAGRVVSTVAAGATGCFAVWQAIKAAGDRSPLAFARAALSVLLFYLLVTCLWYQQWYTVWPLAVAALLPAGRSVYLAFVTGYASFLAKHLVLAPQVLWIRPLPPKSWRELRLGPMVLGVPWLYALTGFGRARRRRRALPGGLVTHDGK